MAFDKPERKILYPKGMMLRILPRQPEWEDQWPKYTEDMTEFEGDIFKLDRDIYDGGRPTIRHKFYSWRAHWLAPATMENE